VPGACVEHPPWDRGPSRRRSVRASGPQGAAEKSARRCGQPNAGRRGPVCRVADWASCRFAGLGSNFYSRVCVRVRWVWRGGIICFISFSTPGCVRAAEGNASASRVRLGQTFSRVRVSRVRVSRVRVSRVRVSRVRVSRVRSSRGRRARLLLPGASGPDLLQGAILQGALEPLQGTLLLRVRLGQGGKLEF
jgi:hypothetical protein